MMQKPRLEDVKDDELLRFLLTAWDYIEDNYPKILAGIGGVVVVVLIALFVGRYQSEQTIEAQNMLGEAEIELNQVNLAGAIAKFEQVAADFSDAPAGRQALLMAANLQYETNNYGQAQAGFQAFLDKFGSDGPQGYGAWSGLASCLEAQGNLAEAGEKLAAYAEAQPQTPFAPIALKEAGRCFKAVQNFTQAQAMYQKIVDKYAKAGVAGVARSELQQLGATVN